MIIYLLFGGQSLYVAFYFGGTLYMLHTTLYLVIEKMYSVYEGHFCKIWPCATHLMFLRVSMGVSTLVVNGGDVESHS
jgi:hypothetical protein